MRQVVHTIGISGQAQAGPRSVEGVDAGLAIAEIETRAPVAEKDEQKEALLEQKARHLTQAPNACHKSTETHCCRVELPIAATFTLHSPAPSIMPVIDLSFRP